jgi:signal transduction histidine kinase
MLPSTESLLPTLPVPLLTPGIEDADANSLNRAFAWFSDAATSLERSYSHLQTEVIRLREELARKQDELDCEREQVRQSKAMADVSAVLAHELRNPLAGMELFAELLMESGGLSKEPRNWAQQLHAGLRTMTATINNVLQMHAAEPNAFSPLRLDNVLDAAVQFLTPIAEQSGVELALEDWTDGTQISGDTYRLQQVLLNLAMNAFRAMPEGGLLRIIACTRWDHGRRVAEIEVQDTGSGIAPPHFEKIFDVGFTTRPGSVGLGLAVCRKIVEQHQGTIRVASSSPEGTSFVLTFPTL